MSLTRNPLWMAVLASGAVLLLPILLGDARTHSLAINTLLLAAAVAALSVPAGTLCAVLLVRTNIPGRQAAMLLLGLLLFVPLYLQVGAWQAGFGLQGWYTLAVESEPLLKGFRGAVWVHAMAAIPWVVLFVGCGLSSVHPQLEEKALLDLSLPWVFVTVTLPRSLGAITAAALWVAIQCSAEMTVTDLFRVRTYAEELYTQLATGMSVTGASLGVLPGIALAFWLVVAGMLLAASVAPPSARWSPRTAAVFPLHGKRWLAGGAVWGLLLILAGIPLVNLVYRAGILVEQTEMGRVRSWSAMKCAEMVATSVVRQDPQMGGALRPGRFLFEFGWSLGVGVLAATVAVAAAALVVGRGRVTGVRSLAALCACACALALPAPLLGLAIIKAFDHPGAWMEALYDRSVLAPVVAQGVRAFPLAALLLWHAVRTVPDELFDLAACDGLSHWQKWWYVVFPLRWPAVAVAWLVAFAVALSELGASILVVPPRVTLLTVRLWTLLHYGVDDLVAGVYLALLGFFAVLATAAFVLARTWLKRLHA